MDSLRDARSSSNGALACTLAGRHVVVNWGEELRRRTGGL